MATSFPSCSPTLHLAPNILVATLYAVLFLILLFRIWQSANLRIAYIMASLVALTRVTTFAVRASLAHDEKSGEAVSRGLSIGASVLVIAGFYIVLELVIVLFTRFLQSQPLGKRNLQKKKTVALIHLTSHLVLSSISIIGIVGGIQQSNATSPSSSNNGHDLRVASGVLFLIISIGLTVCISFVVMVDSLRTHTKGATGTSTTITKSILILFGICCIVEAIYRLSTSLSIHDCQHSFFGKEAATFVLVALPELVLLAILSLVPISYLCVVATD